MNRLKTQHIASLLDVPCEAVRAMVREGVVAWGVYTSPKTKRYGHGRYVYYPERFSADTGIDMGRIKEAMQA